MAAHPAAADIDDSTKRKRYRVSLPNIINLHNGDQATPRHRMMCSICGRRFVNLRFGERGGSEMNSFGSPPHTGFCYLSIDTYDLSLTVFELSSWLQECFRPPARREYHSGKYRSRSYHFVEGQKLYSLLTLIGPVSILSINQSKPVTPRRRWVPRQMPPL